MEINARVLFYYIELFYENLTITEEGILPDDIVCDFLFWLFLFRFVLFCFIANANRS